MTQARTVLKYSPEPAEQVFAGEKPLDQAVMISVDAVNTKVYYWVVTAKEFRKLLKAKGCTFRHATGHEKVFLGDRFTFMPRHGTDRPVPV